MDEQPAVGPRNTDALGDAAHIAQIAEAVRAAVVSEGRKRARLDLDVRGVLALMCVVGSFALAFVQLFRTGSAEIPSWATAVVGGVVGFYFGARGGSGEPAMRQGVPVADMAVLSAMTALIIVVLVL